MNAYLFTAATNQTQMCSTQLERGQTADRLQTWDSCVSMIVCAYNPSDACKLFDSWLHHVPEGENPVQIEIKKLVAAQFLEEMLSETAQEEIDWAEISNRVEPTLPLGEDDNQDQGYWADVNQLVRPNKSSATLESLKTDLSEGIRSGLNWSAGRQFFFVLSVLRPVSMEMIPDSMAESNSTDADDAPGENPSETQNPEFDSMLSELADKEIAALVHARNAVVAAWLWRKFAANTQHASNDIMLEPWCGLILND